MCHCMVLHQLDHSVHTANMNNRQVLHLRLVDIDIGDDNYHSPLELSADGNGDCKDVNESLSDQEETDLEEEISKSLAGGAPGRHFSSI